MNTRRNKKLTLWTIIAALSAVFSIITLIPRGVAEPNDKPGAERRMIRIPGGRFVAGMNLDQLTRFGLEFNIDPAELVIRAHRELDLPAFFIDKYEVTNRQYHRFLRNTGHRLPLAWLDKGFPPGGGQLPVTGIDFHDAEAYCQWAAERLPSEEEWEKAARGSDGRLWTWGNKWEPAVCKIDVGG
jgi:iron(II)-dependent oxidoreductase